MLPKILRRWLGWRHRIVPVAPMARRISMGARREVVWAVAERYGAAGRRQKGRILDELTATTGWHRKHAVRALSAVSVNGQADCKRVRRRPARSTARHSHRPVGGASTQVLAMPWSRYGKPPIACAASASWRW
jgi:hypothetical protein